MLLIQRQGGILKIFKKNKKIIFQKNIMLFLAGFFALPIFLIAISGAYLTFDRFMIGDLQTSISFEEEILSENKYLKFDLIALNKVKKVVYPFSRSESDYYTIG